MLHEEIYQPGDWHELGKHCSLLTERRADDATRDVESWLKCFYMQDRIECFDGVVSSVTGFGLFVALDNVYVEGLVHISELPSDYFHFDAIEHTLLGERSGKKQLPSGRPGACQIGACGSGNQQN